MSLTLDENHAAYQIKSYQPGIILVNDITLTKSLIISPQKILPDWEPQSLEALTAEHLQIILSLQPAILLLGTGAKLVFPALAIYGDLINHGIGVEIMDTHAASRTFNALVAEDRNVVAALILN